MIYFVGKESPRSTNDVHSWEDGDCEQRHPTTKAYKDKPILHYPGILLDWSCFFVYQFHVVAQHGLHLYATSPETTDNWSGPGLLTVDIAPCPSSTNANGHNQANPLYRLISKQGSSSSRAKWSIESRCSPPDQQRLNHR